MCSSTSPGAGSEGFCRDSGRSAGADLDIVLATACVRLRLHLRRTAMDHAQQFIPATLTGSGRDF